MKKFVSYIKNHLNTKILLVFMGSSASTVFILLVILFYIVFSNTKSFATEEQLYNLIRQMIIACIITIPIITLVMITVFLKFLNIIIVKPVNTVKQVTQTISNGDYSFNISNDVKSNDEIGVMMQSLSTMVNNQKIIVGSINDYTAKLAVSSEEMEGISKKMVFMSQDQAAAMEETSAALEETLASMEMINGHSSDQYNRVDENSVRMADMAEEARNSYDEALAVSKLMDQTASRARESETDLNTMVREMENIKNSTLKIEEIIKIITDISEQVNLLSLNAAIEAARAGEHGRGFAVVADEISKLAEETAVSAKTINNLVRASNDQADSGTEIVNRTASTFRDIIAHIEEVSETISRFSNTLKLLADTAQGSRERTRAIKEISRSISDSTEEQMKANKEMSATIEKVNEDSQVLVEYADSISRTSEDIRTISLELKKNLKNVKV